MIATGNDPRTERVDERIEGVVPDGPSPSIDRPTNRILGSARLGSHDRFLDR
ncbi:hypothetical protein AB7C87_15190 [Natrarchaeobius sp. A-rgal3]|uniref:hypothetical protein n=1 Tax=Natrarchaeobius versutus TaxID=1679078 RepID=UPI003510C72A